MSEIGKVLVPGVLRSVADGGILAYSTDIRDKAQGKRLSQINENLMSMYTTILLENTQFKKQLEELNTKIDKLPELFPTVPDVPVTPEDKNEYKWKVITEAEYETIEPDPNVLYFIIDEEYVPPIESETILDGNTIKMTTNYTDSSVSVIGTLENKKLTLL